MSRVAVKGTIGTLLDTAGNERSGVPEGFTHRELATKVYGQPEPTAAQLSAVRRAVARLVDEGRAVRDSADRWGKLGWRAPSTRCPCSAPHSSAAG